VPLITMTTDFGLSDGYVGAMKGVILGIVPGATIIDITHDIHPHGISDAAFVIATVAPYFPAGTVHLVVVDPGVGSERRAIAARVGEMFFVAPDNGVLTHVLRPFTGENPQAEIVHLTRREYWLSQVSNTFHGRDIFSPVAAHLARGVPLGDLGDPIDDPVLLDLPQPRKRGDGALEGHVIYVDRFGNLITNIPGTWLDNSTRWQIEVAGRMITRLCTTYADAPRGHLLALIGSAGMLELSVREGSAALTLGTGEGTRVIVRPIDQ